MIEFLPYLLGITGLILISAFFSGSETAMTAVSDRAYQLAREGNWRASMVIRLREDKEYMIAAILLGNNIANVLASSLAAYVMILHFGDVGLIYATLLMTFLLVVFAEVLPKTLAVHYADTIAFMLIPFLRAVIILMTPFTRILQFILKTCLAPFDMKIKFSPFIDPNIRREALRGSIERHKMEFVHERKMMSSILDLEKVDIASIMTHRSNVVMIDKSMTTEKIIDLMLKSPYTRLPLYDSKPEDIVGILHSKDLLRTYRAQKGQKTKIDIKKIATEPWFIPETTNLLEQLRAFQSRRGHFALVVDEYGAFMGIVTLEDIIEEIVGNIDDEHDIRVSGIRRENDGDYIIRGDVTIRDLNREFEWQLPEDKAATIAGLLIHEAQILPEAGQIFQFHGFRFTILRKTGNRITTLRMATLPKTSQTQP